MEWTVRSLPSVKTLSLLLFTAMMAPSERLIIGSPLPRGLHSNTLTFLLQSQYPAWCSLRPILQRLNLPHLLPVRRPSFRSRRSAQALRRNPKTRPRNHLRHLPLLPPLPLPLCPTSPTCTSKQTPTNIPLSPLLLLHFPPSPFRLASRFHTLPMRSFSRVLSSQPLFPFPACFSFKMSLMPSFPFSFFSQPAGSFSLFG